MKVLTRVALFSRRMDVVLGCLGSGALLEFNRVEHVAAATLRLRVSELRGQHFGQLAGYGEGLLLADETSLDLRLLQSTF